MAAALHSGAPSKASGSGGHGPLDGLDSLLYS